MNSKTYKLVFLLVSILMIGGVFYFISNNGQEDKSKISNVKYESSYDADAKKEQKDKNVDLLKEEFLNNEEEKSRVVRKEDKKDKNEDLNEDLSRALERGDSEYLFSLIDSNQVSVDHRLAGEMTLLASALDLDNQTLIEGLVSRGADLKVRDENGVSVLDQAVMQNNLSITIKALEAGEDPNVSFDFIDSTLAMYAAQEGFLEVLKELYKFGANLDQQNLDGDTALMWAVDTGQKHIVEWLLNNGVDTELVNNDDLKAIDYAEFRDLETIKQMLSQ